VPTAFSREPCYTCSNTVTDFPVGNRESIGQIQSISALSKYLNQFPEHKLVDALSDFHVLIYLAINDTIPLKVSFGFSRLVMHLFEIM